MIAYLILGFFCLILILAAQDKKKGLKYVFYVTTFFLGIRYMWGNDYGSYLMYFNDYNSLNTSIFDFESNQELGGKHNEFGWVLLLRIFGSLGVGFFGFVIVMTIFENWVLHRIVSKYVEPRYYWVAVVFYVFSTSFCINASMMRQYLCICLYLLVVELMVDKKARGYLVKSIALILLGATIHRSNAVMLVTLPLYYIHFSASRKAYSWMIVVGVVFVLWSTFGYKYVESLMLYFIESNDEYAGYSRYLYQENSAANSGLGVIFRYIVLGAWLWLLPKSEEREKQTFILLAVVSYFLEVVMAVAPMASRFQGYFAILDMVRWAWLLQYAKRANWLYVVFVGQLAIKAREIPGFFFSDVWYNYFYHYHTIFSAPMWM